MNKSERLGIIFLIIILFFSIFSSIQSKGFAFISSKLMLAKAGDIKPSETDTPIRDSSPVKIIHGGGSPIVELEKITDNQVIPPNRCETPEYFNRYPLDTKKLAKDAKCTSGYMEGSVLNIKIANANGSISQIDELIGLLKGTLNNLNSRGTIDGISLVGVPAGAELKTTIENADNISVACINNDGNKLKDQRVGKYSPVSDVMFVSMTDEQKNSLAQIKNGIKDLNSQISSSGGNASDNVQKLLLQSLEIVKKFKTDFMPVDSTLLSDHPSIEKLSTMKMSVDLDKGSDNKFIIDNPNKLLSYKISIATRFMSGIPHISEPYFKGRVTLTADDQTIQNDKVVIPEPVIFADLKETITNKINDLTKIRAKFAKNLSIAQDAKKKLEANGYYCQL